MIEIKRRTTGEVLHTVEADTLEGADLRGTDLRNADLRNADLRNVDVSGVLLIESDLSGANLTSANLSDTSLIVTDLSGADLGGAILNGAVLTGADLSGTNLTQAFLSSANFINADLNGANLTHAFLWETQFAGCISLHLTQGLETVHHNGASNLDARTLRACVNHLPDVFLQGVGYNQQEIDYLRSMYAGGITGGGIRYYSCFLSYAHQDNDFAEKLYQDLKHNDVNCWKDTYGIPTGSRWAEEIDKALKSHDKLVLVCSRRSIYREQVVREIVQAVEEERSSGRQMFFPVNLDSHIYTDEMLADARESVKSGEWKTNWVAHVRKYQSADFSQWPEEAAYQKALGKLLHDLKNPQKRE